MASTFSRARERIEDDLETQVARLSKEVAHLRKSAAKKGSHAYSGARDTMAEFYEEAWDRIVDAMPDFRSQARRVNRTARDNPTLTAAVVGVVVVGLLASLLLRPTRR